MMMRLDSGLPDDLEKLCQGVIGAAIEVHREFGPGFAEQTYHRAMMVELDRRGIAYQSEAPVQLTYRDVAIGEGKLDLLVDQRLVVELKAAEPNKRKYTRQVAAYLKATGLRLGLIINFEADPLKDGIARIIH